MTGIGCVEAGAGDIEVKGGTDSHKSILDIYLDTLRRLLNRRLTGPLSEDEEESFVVQMNDYRKAMTPAEQEQITKIFSKLAQ